ncbi:MAG: plastocyanin/azurin family copper-binding protein, partial [Limibaculum sp.]
MIRLFVLIGIVGGGAITYLATYGVGPEAQLPPAVSQLEKFEAAGLIPGANALEENEEVGHGVFEVPPEDEARLEMALANASAMDMGGSGTMDMGGGSTMDMGATATGSMGMSGTESGSMDMKDGEMAMAEGGLLISEEGAFDREIDLTMAEWKFSDMRIDVKMGERIKFTVKNDGKIPHEFMFMTMPAMAAVAYRATRADWSLLEHEALFEQSLVLPGGDFSFVIEIQQAGSWMFMCMLPYHMQMGMMGQMATPGMDMQM